VETDQPGKTGQQNTDSTILWAASMNSDSKIRSTFSVPSIHGTNIYLFRPPQLFSRRAHFVTMWNIQYLWIPTPNCGIRKHIASLWHILYLHRCGEQPTPPPQPHCGMRTPLQQNGAYVPQYVFSYDTLPHPPPLWHEDTWRQCFTCLCVLHIPSSGQVTFKK
jgi:hypothetical protein